MRIKSDYKLRDIAGETIMVNQGKAGANILAGAPGKEGEKADILFIMLAFCKSYIIYKNPSFNIIQRA